MDTKLWAAVIAAGVALLSAAGTIWSSLRASANTTAIEKLKLENQRMQEAATRQKEISRFSEPLARSAYDLQSRIYNILKQNLVRVYLTRGNQREKVYVENNTAFLICQYFCWSELVRREIQYIDLGVNEKTRQLQRLQDTIYVTVHIPPLWRRSSRAAIQAAAMAGIGGEGRLARAAAMSVQA